MPVELPIACSLSAADLPGRLAEMAALGDAALLDAQQDATHAELRFAAGAGVRERVEAIVAAESQCCAFLTMRVTGEPDTIVLTIDAPEGAELILQELVDAFRGRAASGLMSTTNQPRGRSDYALVGGGLLMVLCCAAGPAVIGAVAGSAIGGWLGIACAVVLAAAVGLVLHRRTRRRGGC